LNGWPRADAREMLAESTVKARDVEDAGRGRHPEERESA
jgi:hypothetical protein